MSKDFQRVFFHRPDVEARTHGALTLMGDGLLSQGGYLLAIATPQATRVQLRKRQDGRVVVRNLQVSGLAGSLFDEYALGSERKQNSPIDFFQGATQIAREQGFFVEGFDCLVSSNLPLPSDFAADSSLQMALLKSMNQLFDWEESPLELATLGQTIEKKFLGLPTGNVDHVVSSLGSFGDCFFVDSQNSTYQPLEIPLNKMGLLVMHSGVHVGSGIGGFSERREQLKRACEILGVQSLREISVDDLSPLRILPETLRRRAVHVIQENQRTWRAVSCIEKRDLASFGSTLSESHKSLREQLQVSFPEVDFLVELLRQHPQCFGARLVGETTVVAVVEPGMAWKIGEYAKRAYEFKTKLRAAIQVPPAASDFRSEFVEAQA